MAAAPAIITPLGAPFNRREIYESQRLQKSFLNRLPLSSSTQTKRPAIEKPQLPPPEHLHLGMFDIGKPLGKGKFGRVYLVRHRKSGYVCALKVLHKKEICAEKAEIHVRREIEVHQNLRHPNILLFLGWFYDSRRIFIMLEFAVGGEMYKVLRNQGRFSEARAAKYIAQVADALRYMHKKKMMHRDLKPENLLLGIHGEVKLADFGYGVHAPSGRRMTVCGTPDYLPPEMLRASCPTYTPAVDLWTLGVLTYEFLVGSAPFEGETDQKTMRRIIKGDMTPFPSHVPNLARSFILSLLHPDGNKRPSWDAVLQHPWIVKHCNTTQ